eukprot:3626354-Rhodomonas_salina.2
MKVRAYNFNTGMLLPGRGASTRPPPTGLVGPAICLRSCYAMSGTDIPYRWPVLTYRIVLCDVQY